MKLTHIVAAISFAALSMGAAQAAVVETTDFIGSPANFNGFESIGNANSNGDHGPSYSEGGISVNQINGEGNDIWTTYLFTGSEGNFAWYPNGGDYGYTAITMQDGSDFGDISFIVGSGYGGGTHSVYYELANNGSVVQNGTLSQASGTWLGFSGGGFDEVRVRDSYTFTSSFTDGATNAIALDSIKTVGAIPEPGTYALMLAGLSAVGFVARRRRA